MEKNPGKVRMAILMFLLFLPSEAAPDLPVVTVHHGQDAILPCQADDPSIIIVEWSRDEHILFYSDKETDTIIHNPSYKGRVDLSGNELSGGDASLILKNVSSIDTGTYKCRVVSGGFRRKKRAIIDSEPIGTIHLQVTEQGSDDRNSSPVGRYRGLAAGALLLVAAAVVGVLIYKRHKDKS
ncbi:coxsackievirus and adenovirus receptor homolog [Perca fluviatilis]|uniref:coxsackievirus and adenovirus receptor homolog n=1 Tax=Perca fluviatilis TaxID=8168 RepID=UPI00196517AB|nr:coxsackievirus and adenovirus receptor homolog [Perca fluviatilis]